LSLSEVSKAHSFGEDKAKSKTGTALINYFCKPCKPTKANGGRTRNHPEHDLEKWEAFKAYCVQDVEAEREICKKIEAYELPAMERDLYILDQKINDLGLEIDINLAESARDVDEDHAQVLKNKVKELTGVDNPNSVAQLKDWISKATGEKIESLAKDKISNLLDDVENEEVREVLRLRQKLSKSSIKKYTSMINCVCEDGRGRGFFQFYGANRTGRWAGRLVQLQNLPRNYLPDLTTARRAVKTRDYKDIELLYGDLSDTLSQLIRTAFVAPKSKVFAVADFSAIEARVIAWLAQEDWRLEVFKTHGKIYEASASSMFGVPIEEIGKGSPLRQKGKVAELALGYQGAVGALTQMGGADMGLSDKEMQEIVDRWRKASPAICQLWKDLEGCAKRSVRTRKTVKSKHRGLEFISDKDYLRIKLPSGRELFYREPVLKKKLISKGNGEGFEVESIQYMGMDQTKKTWTRLDTYGGKLTENIVQAIARDLLGFSMLALDKLGFKIVMHVHDEVICEVADFYPKDKLSKMCKAMSAAPEWAEDLPLAADGYLTKYYKKD
jgi:DNA polymerase